MTLRTTFEGDASNYVRGARQAERATRSFHEELADVAREATAVGLGVAGVGAATEAATRLWDLARSAVAAYSTQSAEARALIAGTREELDGLTVAIGSAVAGGGNLEIALGATNVVAAGFSSAIRDNEDATQRLTRGGMRALVTVARGLNVTLAGAVAIAEGVRVGWLALRGGAGLLYAGVVSLADAINQNLASAFADAVEAGQQWARSLDPLIRRFDEDLADGLASASATAEQWVRDSRESAEASAADRDAALALAEAWANDYVDGLSSARQRIADTMTMARQFDGVLTDVHAGLADGTVATYARQHREAAGAVAEHSEALGQLKDRERAAAAAQEYAAEREAVRLRTFKDETRAAEELRAAAAEREAFRRREELEALTDARAARADYAAGIGTALASIERDQEKAGRAFKRAAGGILVTEGTRAIYMAIIALAEQNYLKAGLLTAAGATAIRVGRKWGAAGGGAGAAAGAGSGAEGGGARTGGGATFNATVNQSFVSGRSDGVDVSRVSAVTREATRRGMLDASLELGASA